MFYGGRLLSHLSAADPNEPAETISIFRVNRHSAIIIDSDKRAPDAEINATKTRIVSEIKTVGGYAWVTAGKEIENYIPCNAIGQTPHTITVQVGPFESFSDYLKAHSVSGYADSFERKKVQFAEDTAPRLSKAEIERVLDVKDRLVELIGFIRRCNGEREPANLDAHDPGRLT